MTVIRPEEVHALIETFDDSAWDEMRISTEGFEIRLAKDASARDRGRLSQQTAQSTVTRLDVPAADSSHEPRGSSHEPTQVPTTGLSGEPPLGHVYLRAANLGTFYKAPKPGASAYVEIGQAVEVDTEVCVIEVMKLFTPMYAGVRGVLRKVLVEDTELVEFDQPLFLIEVTD